MKKMKNLTVNGESFAVWDPEAARIDDSQVGADAWSGKNTVDKLCPPFEKTGFLVTCQPVEGYPLEVVPSGTPTCIFRTGKNLFDFKQDASLINTSASSQRYGYALRLPPGTYTASAVSHTEISHYIYSRILYADGTYGDTINIVAGTSVKEQTYQLAQGDVLIIYNGSNITGTYGTEAASQTLFKEKFDIQLEAGDGATAYEPYRGGEFAPGEAIPALAGRNFLRADAGEITVTGRADPVAILQKLMGGAADV